MIRTLITLLTIFVMHKSCVAQATSALEQDSEWPPTVRLSKKQSGTIDLGGTKIGSVKKTAELSIHNDLNHEVTIVNLRLSCGCMTAKLDRKTIPANESATLKLELATRVGGKQNGVVFLETSSLSDDIQIQINWSVWHDLVLEVEPISFGQVEAIGSKTIEFRVWRMEDSLERVEPVDLKVNANPAGTLEADVQGERVRLTLKDPSKEMTQSGFVLLSDSKMEKGQSVQIPVFWNVRKQPVIASPTIVFTKAGENTKASIQIVNLKENLGEVKSVKSALSVIDWKAVRRSKSAVRVDIEIAASKDQRGSAALNIEFDAASDAESAHIVTIPINVQ